MINVTGWIWHQDKGLLPKNFGDYFELEDAKMVVSVLSEFYDSETFFWIRDNAGKIHDSREMVEKEDDCIINAYTDDKSDAITSSFNVPTEDEAIKLAERILNSDNITSVEIFLDREHKIFSRLRTVNHF